jgi:exopolyphosphatase/guanosine-5'-triphosphate,3'-diphosphate pyrophosphatase
MAKGSLAARPRRSRKREHSRGRFPEGRAPAGLLCRRRHLAKPRQAAHEFATNYPLAVMHHYEMALDEADAFLTKVARGDIDKIKASRPSPRARRALLPYGAIVLQEIIAAMKPSEIVVLGARRARGLSLFAAAARRRERGRPAALRGRGTGAAARPLARPCARAVDWTARFAGGVRHRRRREEARYRQAACLLADIGWRAHPEYRGTQSLNIIAHASFIGVDHPGRAVHRAGQCVSATTASFSDVAIAP